jgi:hypothetical protein
VNQAILAGSFWIKKILKIYYSEKILNIFDVGSNWRLVIRSSVFFYLLSFDVRSFDLLSFDLLSFDLLSFDLLSFGLWSFDLLSFNLPSFDVM